MKRTKLLAFTLLMTVPLASCSFGKKTNPVLTADVEAFLSSRGVTGVTVPVIASVADKDVADSGATSKDDIPCFEFVVSKDVTKSYKSKLTKANWTITEGTYFEATDPNNEVAVQYYVSEKSTYTYIYAYDDLYGTDPGPGPSTGIARDVSTFLSGRGVSGVDFSFLNNIDTSKITSSGVEDGSSGEYIPCIYYTLEGDMVNSLLSLFRSANWNVPSSAGEYGYEVLDPSGSKVEADVLLSNDETGLTFYAVADLNGGGGEGGEGGGESIDDLQKDLATFMKARGIDSVTIPFISSVSASDILAGNYSTEPVTEDGETYPPYFYFQVSGDKVSTYLSALSNSNWSVPSSEGDYGYECVDPTGVCEVDLAYIDEETAELYAMFGLDVSVGTTVYVYAVADLDGSGEGGEGGEGGGDVEGDTLSEKVTSYMSGRGVSGVSFTFLDNIDESLIESATAYAAEDDYAPYFEVVLTGDVESSVLSIFRNANWTVPTTAGDYGYECIDPSGSKAEADVMFYESYTYIDFYAYDDIYGEGGEGGEGGGDIPTPTDAIAEPIILDFTGITETGTALTEETTLSTMKSAAGSDSSHIVNATSTKVYAGNGTSGAHENEAGLIKFGSSSANGELVITFDGLFNKVEINCHDFYKVSEKYPTNNNTISVNGGEPVLAPYNDTGAFEVLTFELSEASNVLTIVTAKRITCISITVSYVD